MFWKPLKQVVLGVEGFLESAVLRVCGILVLILGQERRKSHDGAIDKIIGMVDACFELWYNQVLCDIVGEVAIDSSFTNGVHGDEVSKEADEQSMIGTGLLRQLFAGEWCIAFH